MVRNIRPSWIEVDIDGRETLIESGPRSRSGNMYIKIYVRKEGEIHQAASINLMATTDGKQVVMNINADGEPNIRKEYSQ